MKTWIDLELPPSTD